LLSFSFFFEGFTESPTAREIALEISFDSESKLHYFKLINNSYKEFITSDFITRYSRINMVDCNGREGDFFATVTSSIRIQTGESRIWKSDIYNHFRSNSNCSTGDVCKFYWKVFELDKNLKKGEYKEYRSEVIEITL
jgi:hypothetical protein